MTSKPTQKKRRLTFLTDELVHKPNKVPKTFREHRLIARYRNGEIMTDWMFWTTLTVDPSGYYWLVLEAGRQHLPGQAAERWIHHGTPEMDSLESSVLAVQPVLGGRGITWATRRVTEPEACNWLEQKVVYVNSWEGSAYMKFDLALRQKSVEELLAATGHSFSSLRDLLNGAALPEKLGEHHPFYLF